MKMRPRIYYTETDKALMWDRWQKGESLNSIARLFDRGHSSIQRVLILTATRQPIRRGITESFTADSICGSSRRPFPGNRRVTRSGILGTVYLIHHTPDPFCGFGILSPVFRFYWLTST